MEIYNLNLTESNRQLKMERDNWTFDKYPSINQISHFEVRKWPFWNILVFIAGNILLLI